HSVMGEVDREAAIADDPGDGLHVGERRDARRASGLDDASRPLVAEHDRACVEDRPTERRPPVRTGGVHRDLGDDHVDHAVEEVLLAADMGVERHGLDAQLLAQPAHAHGVDAFAIGEIDRSLKDPRPGQRRPPLLAFVPGLNALQSSLLTPLRRMGYLTPYGPSLTAYGRPERTT